MPSQLSGRVWTIRVCPACGGHKPIGTCACQRPKRENYPNKIEVVALRRLFDDDVKALIRKTVDVDYHDPGLVTDLLVQELAAALGTTHTSTEGDHV